jgi:hypothetical protein
MAERTFVLTVGVVPGTLKFMVVIVHAFCAVLHFSRVIARLAVHSSFHESVGVPGGHGTAPVRPVRSVGCPTLSCIGIISGCPWSTRRL